MNKKGFLLAEETLKIIIAVIAIGFLVYFLVSLYNSNKNSKELEQAESSLDFLIQEIDNEVAKVEIYNPQKWEIVSWSAAEVIPNSCSNLGWQKCICIFKGETAVGKGVKNFFNVLGLSKDEATRLAKKADEGACRESDFSIGAKINSPPVVLEIDYTNKIISVIE